MCIVYSANIYSVVWCCVDMLLTISSDVIDVTVVEPHSMETAEVRGRTRDYQYVVSLSVSSVSQRAQAHLLF